VGNGSPENEAITGGWFNTHNHNSTVPVSYCEVRLWNRKQSISDHPLRCAEESDCLANHTELQRVWLKMNQGGISTDVMTFSPTLMESLS